MIENWFTSMNGDEVRIEACHGADESRTVFAWEQWFALQHFCKYAPSAPNVHYVT
jgi:hypothetical protein